MLLKYAYYSRLSQSSGCSSPETLMKPAKKKFESDLGEVSMIEIFEIFTGELLSGGLPGL